MVGDTELFDDGRFNLANPPIVFIWEDVSVKFQRQPNKVWEVEFIEGRGVDNGVVLYNKPTHTHINCFELPFAFADGFETHYAVGA